MRIDERIAALRAEMSKEKIDAYIIVNSDPHCQLHIAPHWKQREWLSGFTGSTGTAGVTMEVAGLWTDSRYFMVAEQDLAGTEVELFKLGVLDAVPQHEWLAQTLPEGATVAFCGDFVPEKLKHLWQTTFDKAGIKTRTDLDLITRIWEDRPQESLAAAYEHSLDFAGECRKDKLVRVQRELKNRDADCHFISDPAEISWLLNIRGGDVRLRAGMNSYVLLDGDHCSLFCDRRKISEDLALSLTADGIVLEDYTQLESKLKSLDPASRILMDPAKISCNLWQACAQLQIIAGEDVVPRLRMIKNEVEQKGFFEALRQDGIALVKFWSWLYGELGKGREDISEITCRDKMTELRSQRPAYVHDSFDAIMGYAQHGAGGHYTVSERTDQPIKQESLFLIDSGGAYLNGCTDTTRVFPMGEISEQMKNDYTLVLKGVINMSTAIFPKGTDIFQMDAMARAPIWRGMHQFPHGVGHGVGTLNEIHEGPVFTQPRSNVKLEPGIVMTVEPGTYRRGEYGIRIENMLLCVPAGESYFGEFYKYETLTRCPINTNLIDKSLLIKDEIDWLNDYNAKVYQDLAGDLEQNEVKWLEQQCSAI